MKTSERKKENVFTSSNKNLDVYIAVQPTKRDTTDSRRLLERGARCVVATVKEGEFMQIYSYHFTTNVGLASIIILKNT